MEKNILYKMIFVFLEAQKNTTNKLVFNQFDSMDFNTPKSKDRKIVGKNFTKIGQLLQNIILISKNKKYKEILSKSRIAQDEMAKINKNAQISMTV